MDYFDAFYQFVASQASRQGGESKEPNYWQERILRLESLAVQSEPDFGINMDEEWETLLS
jgi:hypothetical protein